MHGTLAPFSARLDRKSLADALKLLAKVTERRNQIPILSCIVLDARGDCVTIRATDLDLFASVEIPAACETSRSVALDLAALKAAVSKSKAASITIADVGGGRATFRDGDSGATLRLPCLPADDFPWLTPAMRELARRFAIPARQLSDDIGRARVAVSTEETRYYLNGIFWHRTQDEYGADVFRMAATDGHRLARISRPVPEGMPDDFPDSILPRKCCDVLALLLAKADAGRDVGVDFSTSAARFAFGRVVICSKLIDGSFPDYSRVIPTSWHRTMTAPAQALAEAAKSVTAHMNERTRAVTFSWDSGADWLTAYAVSADHGPAAIPVTGAEFSALGNTDADREKFAGEFCIGMNAVYLAELMAKWEGQPVTLHCADAACPIRITAFATPEYLQVLMPMRTESAVITPAYIDQLNGSPVDTFKADAPAIIAQLAAIDADSELGKRARRLARCGANRELAGLIQGMIAHMVQAEGYPRRTARLIALLKLATLRGDEAAVFRLNAIYSHQPTGSYLAGERAIAGAPTEDPVQPTEVAGAEADAPMPEPLHVGDRIRVNWPGYGGELATVEEIRPGIDITAQTDSGRYVSGDGNGWEPVQDGGGEPEGAAGGEPEPVESPSPDPLPVPGEAVPVEPETVDADATDVASLPDAFNETTKPLDADEGPPMFRTLQDFKAMAGVGSRWIKSIWRDGAWVPGEHGAVRTVVRVQARDLASAFRDDLTPEQARVMGADKARAGGFAWLNFPKAGCWRSDAKGLIVTYPEGTPNFRFDPLPALEASGFPEGAAPVKSMTDSADGDDVAVLRQMVADMAERLAKLESASQSVSEAPGLPDVAAPESPPVPAVAENGGNLNDYVPRSKFEAMQARAEAAEHHAEQLRGLVTDLSAGITETERRHIARTARLSAALAGRKAQLANQGRDLLFARTRAARLQRDLDQAMTRNRAEGVGLIMPAFSKAG